jgi:hypothetical protein
LGREIDRAIIYQDLVASKSQSLVTAAQQAVELHGKLRANAMRQHAAPRAKKHDNHRCSNTEKISWGIHSKRGAKNEKKHDAITLRLGIVSACADKSCLTVAL